MHGTGRGWGVAWPSGFEGRLVKPMRVFAGNRGAHVSDARADAACEGIFLACAASCSLHAARKSSLFKAQQELKDFGGYTRGYAHEFSAENGGDLVKGSGDVEQPEHMRGHGIEAKHVPCVRIEEKKRCLSFLTEDGRGARHEKGAAVFLRHGSMIPEAYGHEGVFPGRVRSGLQATRMQLRSCSARTILQPSGAAWCGPSNSLSNRRRKPRGEEFGLCRVLQCW